LQTNLNKTLYPIIMNLKIIIARLIFSYFFGALIAAIIITFFLKPHFPDGVNTWSIEGIILWLPFAIVLWFISGYLIKNGGIQI